MMGESRACVFEIREFTVHDGPGGRATVFLKGCPLTCAWCHNPEGQSTEPELLVKTARCVHCGWCRKNSGTPEFARWGREPKACPEALISVCGREMTAAQLVEELLPLKDMLLMNEGGITFSGGEPLLYPDFLEEAAAMLHARGLNTAIETSGYASEAVFRRMLAAMDYVMMDLKLMDDEAHRRWTGCGNGQILKNAKILAESGKPFVFRTPLIPGITDTAENLESLRTFIGGAPWEQLPYNTLAGAKYPMVGRVYPLEEKGE